jgi:hypothetical protein
MAFWFDIALNYGWKNNLSRSSSKIHDKRWNA